MQVATREKSTTVKHPEPLKQMKKSETVYSGDKQKHNDHTDSSLLNTPEDVTEQLLSVHMQNVSTSERCTKMTHDKNGSNSHDDSTMNSSSSHSCTIQSCAHNSAAVELAQCMTVRLQHNRVRNIQSL